MALSSTDLIGRLTANPFVIGLICYGRRRPGDDTPGGDLDLVAVVTHRPTPLESIHFPWGDLPVDLNIRTAGDFSRREAPTSIDPALVEGKVLFDRRGSLSGLLKTARETWRSEPTDPATNETSPDRFYQQHVLDKVRGKLTEDPLFCEMLLSVNIGWLLQTYMRIRGLDYRGERQALEHVRKEDPGTAALIGSFFAERSLLTKLSVSEELTERILASAGGPWRQGEVLGLTFEGAPPPIPGQAEATFDWLLDPPAEPPARASVSLRPGAIADIPLLATMNQRLVEDQGSRNPFTPAEYEQRFTEWLDSDWQISLFQREETAIGYSVHRIQADVYYPDRQVVYLRQFYIEHEVRRDGFGTAAFEALKAARFPANCSICLDVLATNPGGQLFWERLGFEPYFVSMKMGT